jgi:copper oxidase (laccase) domain-containing protein
LAVLSGNEENSALSGAMAQLSEVQKNMEQIHNDQVRHCHIHYLEAMHFLG